MVSSRPTTGNYEDMYQTSGQPGQEVTVWLFDCLVIEVRAIPARWVVPDQQARWYEQRRADR
jgi:hypothetical protein